MITLILTIFLAAPPDDDVIVHFTDRAKADRVVKGDISGYIENGGILHYERGHLYSIIRTMETSGIKYYMIVPQTDPPYLEIKNSEVFDNPENYWLALRRVASHPGVKRILPFKK